MSLSHQNTLILAYLLRPDFFQLKKNTSNSYLIFLGINFNLKNLLFSDRSGSVNVR